MSRYLRKINRRRAVLALSAMLLGPIVLFLALDLIFPLPLPESEKDFAVAVVAGDGAPLRGFPDSQGVWRYPVQTTEVSPLYLEALINYEDRWFRRHPGVNPWALVRGLALYVRHGRAISGGSTLTMQVARILDPHAKTIPGKLKQVFRALQLEYYFSKDEILRFYLNYAPFGGTIEGVQAASFAYLGKSAGELSHAEAALLAVLPQAPSRLRPDRHPERATRARNKVLERLARFEIWSADTVREAKIERVTTRFHQQPMQAPLLARRLRVQATAAAPVRTTIDRLTQESISDLVRLFIQGMPPHTSAAALVVDNKDLAVKAYVGSADFSDNSRFGHVDMIQANRSPGSTLKPFLYALAMEEGLIHSESLLVDAPLSFHGYRPGNFSEGFSGPVSAGEALWRSLNIPAVDLLDRLGPRLFDARLRQGGLHLRYPPFQTPNLSMILGGIGTSLEDLVGAYTAFARQGLAGKPRMTVDAPLMEYPLLNPGAAYIVRQILQENKRTDLPEGRVALARSRQVAWKTGTSYGFRDAWAIGVTDAYTVGVWVGRPDGTPSPGQYGRATAAPLLFSIVDSLPRQYDPPPPIPDTVSRREICWPLGTPPTGPDDPLCHQRRTAWILDGAVPPTLPDRTDRHWLPNPMNFMINPATGLRVEADCFVPNPVKMTIARWPKAAEPWLNPRLRHASRLPKLDPVCAKPVSSNPVNLQIVGIEENTVFRPQGARTDLPVITLSAMGGAGRLFWMLNGDLIAESGIGEIRSYQFQRPGRFRLAVMDMAGNHDVLEIVVLGGNPES